MATGLSQALSRGDIEFHGVPRTDDDLSLAHPGRFPCGFPPRLYGAADRTAAQWAVLMKTVTGKCVIRSGHVENTDFAAAHLEDFVSATGQFVHAADAIFGRHYDFSLRFRKREALPLRMSRCVSGETGICSTLLGWSKS